MTKDALLEIGSEELPASFIPLGMRQLKALAAASLAEHELGFQSIETYGTPRRLAVLILGIGERSKDQERIITGPPAQMAKDAQGQWTAAAAGFAKKQGIKPTDLEIRNGRLSAVLQIKGTATGALLSRLFPEWIEKLDFPKAMRWESSQFRYPRPIRWLSALYGSQTVSFSLAGVRSGKWTVGLAHHSAKKIGVTPAKYVALLKNQCVLVDPAARQEAIRRMAEQSAKRVHGQVLIHEALLEHVANLVEHPVAIVGGFDSAYLDLPFEVLVTCLEHHQKFFPVVQGAGDKQKLMAQFVGIRNGMSVHQEIVREGYERVLAARLADARFFFDNDRRAPLAAKVDALKGVVFQEKLGSLFDKKERVKKLLTRLCGEYAMAPEALPAALEAADLAKADLVSDVVREFPELQGVMARVYASLDGRDAVFAKALEQHYWPLNLTSALPESPLGALLALADKVDTLAADFAIGLIPSGSADPYGLRRAAVGVIRILEKEQWAMGLELLAEEALAMIPEPIRSLRPSCAQDLKQFLRQRFSAWLQEKGFKADEVDAVLEIGGSVHGILTRLQALHDFRAQPEFASLAAVFKRAGNIVRQAKDKLPDAGGAVPPVESLFKESPEQALWASFSAVRLQVAAAKDVPSVLKQMVPLREPLDHFFDKVMVMAEDPAIRDNRLRLLVQITTLFRQIADFSKLQNA